MQTQFFFNSVILSLSVRVTEINKSVQVVGFKRPVFIYMRRRRRGGGKTK